MYRRNFCCEDNDLANPTECATTAQSYPTMPMIDTHTSGFCWLGIGHEFMGLTVLFLVGLTIVGL
jgi:hypothetical protein